MVEETTAHPQQRLITGGCGFIGTNLISIFFANIRCGSGSSMTFQRGQERGWLRFVSSWKWIEQAFRHRRLPTGRFTSLWVTSGIMKPVCCAVKGWMWSCPWRPRGACCSVVSPLLRFEAKPQGLPTVKCPFGEGSIARGRASNTQNRVS